MARLLLRPAGPSCALAGISLIHSKPYDSPSRGKIERFFRTVRDRFLSRLTSELTLDELNEAFSLWLQEDYHHKHHTGIDQRPIDRYQRLRRASAHPPARKGRARRDLPGAP